ncbi:MAG TPA: hypothetical protein VFG76_01070 [Candidatus Polarisedimenticolia bacterium]|nr:hypothetical protein [Candidatus Polarisedimenticolia bacterium]
MPKEPVLHGIQFLVDDAGTRTAVLIDLKKNAEIWEDFYDLAVAPVARQRAARVPGKRQA